MYFTKSCAVLALATGFAAAKPIRAPQELPAYRRSNTSPNPAKRGDIGVFGNGFGGDQFNVFNDFNNFNQQELFLNVKEENVAFVDNGFQQAFVQQAKEVLIIDQQNNGFNNKFNNLARKASFRNQFPDVSTVVMVVKQIQVSVDDGFGQQIEQNVFAQSVIVANRGFPVSQTVLVKETNVVVAQNVFDQFGAFNGFQPGFGGNNNVGFGSGFDAIPTATQDIQFFGAEPTWSSVFDDPAATVAPAWQAELADFQNVDNNNQNNEENAKIVEQERQALEDAQNQDNNDDQNVDDNVDENQDDAENVDENQEVNTEVEQE